MLVCVLLVVPACLPAVGAFLLQGAALPPPPPSLHLQGWNTSLDPETDPAVTTNGEASTAK